MVYILLFTAMAPSTQTGHDSSLDGKDALVREWKSLLGVFQCTEQHLKFIDNHNRPITFSYSELSPGTFASYRNRTILLNKKTLDTAAKELADQGLSLVPMIEVLALKTLPLLVHEICHGLTDEALSLARIDFSSRSFEDEFLAHTDQLRIADEIRNGAKGHLWNKYKLTQDSEVILNLLSWAKKGPSGVEEAITLTYPKTLKRITEQDAAWFPAEYSRLVGVGQKMLLKRERLEKAAVDAANEQERTEARESLAKMPPKDKILENLEDYKKYVLLFQDPKKVEELQRFYRERLEVCRKFLSTRSRDY